MDRILNYKTAGGRELELLLRLPDSAGRAGRLPIYVTITGGGWAQCVKEDVLWFTEPAPSDALAAGMAVASPSYRLCTEASPEEIVTDCMDAVRYLVKHADELGLDPEKLILSGHSAGAHLALMAALADQKEYTAGSPFPEVRYRAAGVCGYASPTVLTEYEGKELLQEGLCAGFFRERAGDAELRRRMSPLCLVRKDMPQVYLIHGDRDEAVFYRNAELFLEKCRAVGAKCRLLTVRGGNHSLEPDARNAWGTVKDVIREMLTGDPFSRD